MRERLTPEGLTPAQAKLASMLFVTKVETPIRKRIKLPSGEYKIEKVNKLVSLVGFAEESDEFALKSHEKKPTSPLSPIYLSIRNLPHEVLAQAGVVLAQIDKGEGIDFSVGIPKAAVPLAKSYSRYSGIREREVLSKEEGDEGKIISSLPAGQKGRVRIVDDVITGGDSKDEAIKAIEAMGFELVDIIVLIDRQQGGIQRLRDMGYNVKAAFTLNQIVNFGLRTGRVSSRNYNRTRDYIGGKITLNDAEVLFGTSKEIQEKTARFREESRHYDPHSDNPLILPTSTTEQV